MGTYNGTAGNDTLTGSSKDDILKGGTGNNVAYGCGGEDELRGGTGNDLLDGNGKVYGGDGHDTLNGDAGNDPIYGDADNVWLSTGSGDDRAYGGIGDDGNGNTVLTFPKDETLVLQGVAPTAAAALGMLVAIGVPCFAAGTRIQTPQGPRPVEHIAPQDMVNLAAPVLCTSALGRCFETLL